MAHNITNRVILPDGNKIYATDDMHGDNVIEQIYKEYGDCKIETCEKVLGKSLDELKPMWTGKITNYLS